MEQSKQALAEPSVKILVSCHKPSMMPPSDLFVPIQVGARYADARLPETVADNTGENISSRNFSFSEMSGQYWAWKNLPEDVDYVGQCHYRRFFCFDGKTHEANDHAQIELPILDQQAIDEYRLADDDLILSALDGADAIVPQSWSVVGVPTPHGPRDTVRAHMEAYELIDSGSFDWFVEMVEQRQPDFAPYVREYLDGDTYIGYNCFILRRDLFEELCAYEFDVLLAFDKLFDYHQRTPTQMRICGYLGEILFSAFVNKLRAEGRARVREVPLTFFFETDPAASRSELPSPVLPAPRKSLPLRVLSKAKRMLTGSHGGASEGRGGGDGAALPDPESAEAQAVLVTVIVPMHNLEAYLRPCLESIVGQTHQRLQVIAVDDGSTDGTLELARAFAAQDARFSVISQPKSNAGEARNRGLAAAEGDYLLFFDGDDIMEPAMVQRMLERALGASADVVVCRAASFYDDPAERTQENFGPFGVDLSRVHNGNDLRDRLFTTCVGWPWDKLFRTDFVRENGLQFQSLSSTNDAAFVFEALALSQCTAFVPEVLALHRRRQGSIEKSRNASPHNAHQAFVAIRDRLSEEEFWDASVEDQCLNWALTHLRWNYRTLEGSARDEAFEDYQKILDATAAWGRERFLYREDVWVRDALYPVGRLPQETLADRIIDLSYDAEDAHRQAKSYATQLQDTRNSVSFRVGRAATAPLRKLRDR